MKKLRSEKHRADVARSLRELNLLFGRKPPDQDKTPKLAGSGAGTSGNGPPVNNTTIATHTQDAGNVWEAAHIQEAVAL